jgi:L-ascorbate metabolism protein UlaG (beta-lactamase superfamily)
VNPEPLPIGFGDWVKREFTKERGPWRKFTGIVPAPCPEERVDGGRLRVTWINHATVLIQMDGLNVLTDPTWAPRSFPNVGPKRRRPPGLSFEDLPPIDAVLVSHDHHDHMDLPTLRALVARHGPRIYAGLGTSKFLAARGVPGVHDLDWWESADVAPGFTVTAVPARHMSGRGLFDGDRRLWCGFVLTGPSGSVYFAGDTGEGKHFAEIAKRFPGLRLALLPIGGFQPPWYMSAQHLGPATALDAFATLGAGTFVPVHFETFPQSDDAETEPRDTLEALLKERPALSGRVLLLQIGGTAEIPEGP